MRLDCIRCPLQANRKVYGHGPLTPRFVVIGESPGFEEILSGKPFVGPSGQLLRKTIEACGADPSQVYYTNACLCRPQDGTPLTANMYLTCRSRLLQELEQLHCKKILTVGGVAYAALTGSGRVESITKLRGLGRYILDYFVVPTYHPAAVLRDSNLFRDMIYDIQKLIYADGPYVLTDIDLRVPKTEQEALELLNFLKSASYLACDLETTGLDPLSCEIISVGIGALYQDGRGLAVILPRVGQDRVFDLPSVRREVLDMLLGNTFDGMWVFHNAKYDLQFLTTYYGQVVHPKYITDTMLLHYALDERPIGKFSGHSLKDLVRTRYDLVYGFDFEEFLKKPLYSRDYEAMYTYQGRDLFFTLKLREDLTAECYEETGDTRLLDLCGQVLVPATLALGNIELQGVKIDTDYLESLQSKLESNIQAELNWIRTYVKSHGGPEDINPKSNLQIVAFLYDVLKLPLEPEGRVAQRNVLYRIARKVDPEKAEFIHRFIAYRELEKTVSTFVKGLLDKCDSKGYVHSDFQVPGTVTGRLASYKPNLHNIPVMRGTEIRNAFTVEDGYVMLGSDYNQLELRVAAYLSGDPDMIGIFQEGKDIHTEVAVTLFKKKATEITAAERTMAKRVDFGIVYGRTGASIVGSGEAEHMLELGNKAWTVQEADQFIVDFLARFPKLRDWISKQHELALTEGYVEGIFGNRRRFPFVPKRLVAEVKRQAVNAPVQGSAGYIATIALTRLVGYLPKKVTHPRLGPIWEVVYQPCLPTGARVLFPVHDAIYIEAREDLAEEVSKIVEKVMSEDLPFESNVPFPCDIKIGKRWGQLEELTGSKDVLYISEELEND